MVEFAASYLVFLVCHVLPSVGALRTRAIARLGRPLYLGLYSLVSLATLAWLISAALRADSFQLWPSGSVTATCAILIMLVACVLFATGATRANPLSVSFKGGGPDFENPGILAVTRHPILWGFWFWAMAHVIANGDVVSILLFGGLAIFAIFGMTRQTHKARRKLDPEAYTKAWKLAKGSYGARLRRAASLRLLVEAGCGVVLFVLLLWLHPLILGVSPLGHF
jgi:uncharacterized membrane protein